MTTNSYNNNLSPIANTRILADRNLVLKDVKGYNDSDIYFDFDQTKVDNKFYILIFESKNINNPYFGGFFLFQGTFPDQYPFAPPNILAKTQGLDTRFHPNYYTNGKCCLSILGTWNGPPWTSCQNIGTISQALKSLFIDNPITCEPGWENSDYNKSFLYNKVVEYRTLIVATLNILDNLPDSFNNFLPIIEKKFIELYPLYIEKLNKLKVDDGKQFISPIYNTRGSMIIQYNIESLLEKFKTKYNQLIYKYCDDPITLSLKSNNNSNEKYSSPSNQSYSDHTNNLIKTSDKSSLDNNNISDSSNFFVSSTNKKPNSTKKSPDPKASNFDTGYTMISSNDNNIWIVIKTKNNIKRWIKKKNKYN